MIRASSVGVSPGVGPAQLPLTHAGVQTAPCGCFFNPQVFCVQWTSNNLLPPATSMLGHSAMSLVGAALWGAQSCGIPPAWAVPGTPRRANCDTSHSSTFRGERWPQSPQCCHHTFLGTRTWRGSLHSSASLTWPAQWGSNIPRHCAAPHI